MKIVASSYRPLNPVGYFLLKFPVIAAIME